MNNTNKNLVDAKEHINNAASELSSIRFDMYWIGDGLFNSTIEQINIVILDLESSVRKLDDHIQQAAIREGNKIKENMNNTNKNLVDANEQINIVILDLESSIRKLDDRIQQDVIRDTLSKMVNQTTIKNKIRHLIAFPILFFIDIGLWLCNMGDWSTLRHQSGITKIETTISNNNIVDIELIRSIVNECNRRAAHGAEGIEHLLAIDLKLIRLRLKMLKQALAINEIKPQ